MKVLFLFHGTTHYFNLITSQINKQPGVEIIYIFPKKKSEAMGDGVFQTIEGANFRLVELEEKHDVNENFAFYPTLDKFLLENKPDIILTSDIHLKGLFVLKNIRNIIKQLNIKIILKTIPFHVNTYEENVRTFTNKINNNPIPPFSSLPRIVRTVFKVLRLDRLYKSYVIDRKLIKEFYNKLEFKKELYNFPDAHVNYIEEAYSIYGSYGVPKEKIFITYNSPDTDYLFSVKSKVESLPPVLPENEFRIIHLSRLVKWKRVDMLITAIHNLAAEFPSIELLVVGEGPEKEKLIRQAQDLGVSNSVTFLGGIYDPEMLGRYLMSSSVYVLAGMGGLSINDAMIFGLPVICSVCDGTEKYLVREGYNGLYFKNGEQESLESKIKELLNNQILRKKMGENSVQIIKDEINIHTVVDGYLRAFNYVLK